MPLSRDDIVAMTSTTYSPAPGVVVSVQPSTSTRINGVTGKVSGAGAIVAGTGYSVVRSSAGTYVVTFTATLSAIPVVVANCQSSTLITTPDTITASSFQVFVSTSGGTGTDSAFDFIAIVPQ